MTVAPEFGPAEREEVATGQTRTCMQTHAKALFDFYSRYRITAHYATVAEQMS